MGKKTTARQLKGSVSMKKMSEQPPFDPPHSGDEGNTGENTPISQIIRDRILKDKKATFFADDNIARFMKKGDKKKLILELTEKFQAVLDTLIIDTDNDPNSRDTAKRMAKMYIKETMGGRYNKRPKMTSFDNIVKNHQEYEGLQLIRCQVKSMCSHHHQPVTGLAYIGVLPGVKLLGLSKFSRLVTWLSTRGTLQEKLTKDIAQEVADISGTEDVGVITIARHGCCENRGIGVYNSTTQDIYLMGKFYNSSLKMEFMSRVPVEPPLL